MFRKILVFGLFYLVIVVSTMAKQPASAITDTNSINKIFEEYFAVRERDPAKALELLQNGILIARQIHSQPKMALLLYHKGYLYRMLGVYNLALSSDLSSLEIFEKTGDLNIKSWLLLDIGHVYLLNQKNYSMALDHFNKALSLFTSLNNKVGIIVANYDLGELYRQMGKFDESLFYLNFACRLSREGHEERLEADSYAIMGQTYMKMNEFDDAESMFNKASALYTKNNFVESIACTFQSMASLALERGEKDKCLDYYNKALKSFGQVGFKNGIAQTYTQIASVYASQNDLNKAVSFAQLALQVADSNLLVGQQLIILPIISNYYSRLNQLPTAYLYLKRYVDIKESSNVKYAQQLESEYTFQNQLHEKRLQEEVDLKRNIVIGSLAGGLLLLLTLSTLIYFKNIELKKSYQHLFKSTVALHEKDQKLAQLDRQSKYNNSTLKNEQHQTLLNDLLYLVDTKKEYLRNDLNLDDLAKQLNTNRTYISQIINDNFNANFSNFINDYRVREAQEILLNSSSRNLTIEAIAQNVGFNSKSSFNTAFKKFTGLTPSNFMEMNALQSKDLDE